MVISHTREQIRQVVISTIPDVTKKVANISLKISDFVNIETKDVSSTVIIIYGIINEKIIWIVPNHMLLKVVYEMNHQQEVHSEDRLDYYKEFINIVTGRIVSNIKNNHLKNNGKLKFTITDFEHFKDNTNTLSYDEAYCFSSEFGNIYILLQ